MEKKKKGLDRCLSVDLFLRFICGSLLSMQKLVPSATLFSIPRLLSTLSFLTDWDALTCTPNNTERTVKSAQGLERPCCLSDLLTFGSFVETVQVCLVNEGWNATLWLQLEMN